MHDHQRLPALRRLAAGVRALATYDTFPQFSAKARRFLYHPLAVLGVAALVAMLCGFFLHPQGFVLLSGIITVIALGIIWPWLSMRGVSGEIRFDRERATEGELISVSLRLGNRVPLAALGLAIRGSFGRDGALVARLPALAGRKSSTCAWSFTPACRGAYPLQAPKLATAFPFGLWEGTRKLHVPAPLLVWPRTYPVGPPPLSAGDELMDGNVSRRKVGTAGEVLGLRPYRRGDSPRRIHWRQSAKHDRLIVCELQSNTRPVIQLILDVDSRVHLGSGADSSREWAIRVAASFASGWLNAGAQIEAVWGGQIIPATSGQTHLHRLLDGLAMLPDTVMPALPEILASVDCRSCSNFVQVIITTDIACLKMDSTSRHGERQCWVVLHAEGFAGAESTRPHLDCAPIQPWLWLASAADVPGALREGWKEARHGT
ncbi:MAG TPA: DUF58 domain-containing protein [Gemmataceae bacterium]|nr:DUF58 domain-containing protein [Gemmataceae bacterium]